MHFSRYTVSFLNVGAYLPLTVRLFFSFWFFLVTAYFSGQPQQPLAPIRVPYVGEARRALRQRGSAQLFGDTGNCTALRVAFPVLFRRVLFTYSLV